QYSDQHGDREYRPASSFQGKSKTCPRCAVDRALLGDRGDPWTEHAGRSEQNEAFILHTSEPEEICDRSNAPGDPEGDGQEREDPPIDTHGTKVIASCNTDRDHIMARSRLPICVP